MRTQLATVLAVVAISASVHATDAAGPQIFSATRADTVHVAPPTGDQTADRASIRASLARAQPGNIIQFAPGIYLVGEIIPVETPRLTMLGHPDGTTLRGCNPAEHEEAERAWVAAFRSGEPTRAWAACGMIEFTGGHVTVRDLTFEYSIAGLLLGCCDEDEVFRPTEGGYWIEGNTFRNTHNSIRAMLHSSEPTVIRDNRFINVFHALSAAVSNFHVLNNVISAPEPHQVPGVRHPGFAIGISPRRPGDTLAVEPRCERNLIVGNRIEGHPDGILVSAPTGATCRDNVIRDNMIAVRRVPVPESWLYADLAPPLDPSDSTFVGTPLALVGFATGGAPDAAPGRLYDNLVEGNVVVGADGIGVQLSNASRTRIVNNRISRISPRDPFPGNTLGGDPRPWREANGSAIWVSSGSNDNEIVANVFEDTASDAIVLEGDRNIVRTRSASDAVRDLGTGNRVTRPDPR